MFSRQIIIIRVKDQKRWPALHSIHNLRHVLGSSFEDFQLFMDKNIQEPQPCCYLPKKRVLSPCFCPFFSNFAGFFLAFPFRLRPFLRFPPPFGRLNGSLGRSKMMTISSRCSTRSLEQLLGDFLGPLKRC